MRLNYISNGPGLRRVVGNNITEIGRKELVLIGPNLEHCWEQHHCTEKEIHEITVQFQNTLLPENLLMRGIMRPIKKMLEKSRRGISFSELAIQNVESRLLNVAQLDGFDYFTELLSILYDLAISRNQVLLSTSMARFQNGMDNEKLDKVNIFLEKNYDRKLTLKELSDFLNMTPVSFNRFIKKHTGKTFVEYLNDVRIGNACRRLIERDDNISDIAYTCGFNSIANFNRAFKRIKGCTPTKFRSDFWGIKKVL
ncbi:MAG: AraC family transcriptional regulator [Bacteroidota bacterium]